MLICLLNPFFIWQAEARHSPVHNYHLDLSHTDFTINDDLTYTKETTLKYTVLTPVGAEILQKHSLGFFSENETLEILEATITEPKGKVIPVEEDNIFDQDLGGRDNKRRAMQKIVIFSRLTPGCQLLLRFRYHIHKLGPTGLNLAMSPELGIEQKAITSTFRLPENTPLKWGQRNGFTIKEEIKDNRKTLHVSLEKAPYYLEPEINMVSPDDVLPLFALTSIQNWEEVGRIYYNASQDRHTQSPDIQALAHQITKDSEPSLEKVKKISRWVTENINYLSIRFNFDDGMVPNKVEDILRHGYGDCKDQTLLLQTLLKAKGVDSVPALVNWGDSYQDFPVATSMQFNHVMLYIPELDIYLNPVSAFMPFGILEDSLTNKRAVLASADGDVRTLPGFSPATHSYRIENHSELQADGNLKGTTNVMGTGIIDAQIREMLAAQGSFEWKANNILSGTVTGGFGTITESIPPFDQNLLAEYRGEWHSPKAYTINRNGFIFITAPSGLGVKDAQALRSFLVEKKRQFPFQVGPRDFQWTNTLKLPSHYKVAFMPDNQTLSNKAGDFISTYSASDNQLHITRRIIIKKNIYEAHEYPDFAELAYAAINDARAVIGIKTNNNTHLPFN
ncbi:DUF3858 domain-containing protein [Endozoicomonas sp. Mp262]|uniref:DUF3858 domain-containing protein n=1 Tax=Endozoicomonas sp. Mp262 TaxID=2919499 RepID=UPI0021D885E5